MRPQKLSQQIRVFQKDGWRPADSALERWALWAEEIEAEVERLREKEVVYTRDIMPMIDELSLHQAAVAEIRAMFDMIPDPSIDFDASVMDVLDRLPGAKSVVDG